MGEPYWQSRAQVLGGLCVLAHGMDVLLGLVCSSVECRAQSSEIQVYSGEMTEPRTLNLTVHNNYVARGAHESEIPGGIVPDGSLTGGTEWSYGANAWSEYGLYLPVYTMTRGKKIQFDGAEMRALLVLPRPENSLFTFGVNLALQYNSRFFDSHAFTAELRPILGAALGNWRFTINPIVETDFSSSSAPRFSPAERIDYTFKRNWSLALEEYAEVGRFAHFDRPSRQQQTLFVVGDYRHGPVSVEAGVGAGLTGASNALTFKLILSCDLIRN